MPTKHAIPWNKVCKPKAFDNFSKPTSSTIINGLVADVMAEIKKGFVHQLKKIDVNSIYLFMLTLPNPNPYKVT